MKLLEMCVGDSDVFIPVHQIQYIQLELDEEWEEWTLSIVTAPRLFEEKFENTEEGRSKLNARKDSLISFLVKS